MAKVTQGDGSDRSGKGSQPVRRAKKLDTYSGRLTQHIGAQIKRWRRARRITAQELSEATERLGQLVPRTVIINIENQRRDYVSVAEVLLIAAALNMPPYLLLAPVGLAEADEILPNVDSSPWRTRGWLMGALPVGYDGFDVVQWNDATLGTKLFDKHRLLVRSYQQATLRLQELDGDRMDLYADREWPAAELQQRHKIRALMLRQLASYLEQIRAHRAEIDQRGFSLPELPPEVEADLSAPASLFPADESRLG
jgi:transcriptional regulator with XRE-family HTH domain